VTLKVGGTLTLAIDLTQPNNFAEKNMQNMTHAIP